MKMTFDIKKAGQACVTMVNKCERLEKLLGNALTGNYLEGFLYI